MSEFSSVKEWLAETRGSRIDPLRAHCVAEGYHDTVRLALASREATRVYDPETDAWSPPDRSGDCAIILEGDRAALVDPKVADAVVTLADAASDATDAAETLRDHGATVQVDIGCRLDVGLRTDELVTLEDKR